MQILTKTQETEGGINEANYRKNARMDDTRNRRTDKSRWIPKQSRANQRANT